ncbi:potassium channel family protein [Thermococcus sp.]
MCEYVYENGRKCELKAVEGSKYCALHIPYDEGERLFGERIEELKEEAFNQEIQKGVTYFEGVHLYNIRISDFRSEKSLIFKNSRIKSLVIESSKVGGLMLHNCTINRLVIIDNKLKTILVKNCRIFGLNILRLDFENSIYIRDSVVRYLMMNSVEHVGKEKPSEEEYGERGHVYGRIEVSGLRDVRRITLNVMYPLLKKYLKELGIEIKERRRIVKAKMLVIRNIQFDPNPRFKRQVRLSIRNFHGQLLLENLEVLGHMEIFGGRIKLPEFVHMNIHNNLILKGTSFYGDSTWNLTVLPNLIAELNVSGFMIVEKCRFSNPRMEEIFYRLARTSWEKSGDKEKADEYYYLEMLAKRKEKLSVRGKRYRRLLYKAEAYFEWLFVDLTCKYGTDWKRPILIWLIAVNVLFPLVYYMTESVEGLRAILNSFLDYEYFSIVTATTLGYGDYHPAGIGKVFASLEALFGMFMWAVFLTVFARKYMR